jgi:hypothetical protein
MRLQLAQGWGRLFGSLRASLHVQRDIASCAIKLASKFADDDFKAIWHFAEAVIELTNLE